MHPSTGGITLHFSIGFFLLVFAAFGFVSLSVFAPRSSERLFGPFEGGFTKLAERRALAIWLLFFSVVIVRLTILPRIPVPIPGIHDEFSYLLMGDTFAHGRLANSAHAMWMSFETFH